MIIRYDNLDLKNGIDIKENFGRSGLKGNEIIASSLHSVASYLAMFAPALPEYFIELYSKKGDLIMDPFSGRGTTALRSREKGRRFVGSDLNPYALILSRFKIANVKIEDLMDRVDSLEEDFKIWEKQNVNIYKRKEYEELLYFYSSSTLKSLIYIRETIGKTWRFNDNIDTAILAFATGIMHGPSRKSGDSIYFSLNMSNSISMAPNYVRKYAIENSLKRPIGSIFQKLRNRICKKFDSELLSKEFSGQIYEHDATMENSNILDNSVDLVITSPPYLSIVNYTNSNWLKLWLLGYNRKKLKDDIKLSDKLKMDEYIIFITKVLNAMENKINPGGHVCLIVGDVADTRLIESVWEKISKKVKYDFVEIYYDNGYSQNKKVLNTMNNRKGKATMIEKILVVKRKND